MSQDLRENQEAITHFLLVEDDEAHSELIHLALESCTLRVSLDHVSDGVSALEYLRSDARPRPDAILLDLHLPRLGGHEVLERIKTDPALKTIPVIVLSTSMAERDRARAYALNANSYLSKPLDFDQFERMMKSLFFYWGLWNHPSPPCLSGELRKIS